MIYNQIPNKKKNPTNSLSFTLCLMLISKCWCAYKLNGMLNIVNITPANNKHVSIQLCHSHSLSVQQSEEGVSGVALSPASKQAQVKTTNRGRHTNISRNASSKIWLMASAGLLQHFVHLLDSVRFWGCISHFQKLHWSALHNLLTQPCVICNIWAANDPVLNNIR